jgi:hypothetical protein
MQGFTRAHLLGMKSEEKVTGYERKAYLETEKGINTSKGFTGEWKFVYWNKTDGNQAVKINLVNSELQRLNKLKNNNIIYDTFLIRHIYRFVFKRNTFRC